MDKSVVIEKIRATVQANYEKVLGAAMDAASYAKDPDSKAESKYDTRGLEASYLAAGQSAKADEMAEDVRYFSGLAIQKTSEYIDHGSLTFVEITGDDEPLGFFLLGRGGGIEVEHERCLITILTPDSPLYQSLLEKPIGAETERPKGRIAAIY